MLPLELGDAALVLFAAVLAGVLVGTALAWRRLQSHVGDLPLRRLLSNETAGLREAEVRCALCAWQQECRRRLAAGITPPPQCPNAAFLGR
jgi:hypothetical protein